MIKRIVALITLILCAFALPFGTASSVLAGNKSSRSIKRPVEAYASVLSLEERITYSLKLMSKNRVTVFREGLGKEVISTDPNRACYTIAFPKKSISLCFFDSSEEAFPMAVKDANLSLQQFTMTHVLSLMGEPIRNTTHADGNLDFQYENVDGSHKFHITFRFVGDKLAQTTVRPM